ncbi:CGNR zinc finger domain-containing protein [Streptomyces sp. NPDC001822]|uniref:CGNR zinc finger domain-containing protein n=1 Tax=Streptomyces sp. NPDC001822 TaxID=3364614 RepID=UPI0036B0176C
MMHAFAGGAQALDFAGTLRYRHRAEPREDMHSPEALSVWFRESGILDRDIPCGTADLREALVLREAVYHLIVAKMADRAPDHDALALVNDYARGPAPVPQLTPDGRRHVVDPSAAQAFAAIAQDTVSVLGGPEVALLKECGNPECSQVYIDRSRGSRREWCAMDPCGNKIKAAAYRARKRVSALKAASTRSR